MRSERTGGPLSKSTAYQYLNHPENLYGWLLDHRADLARAVGDDRWLALGIEHTRFSPEYGEKPEASFPARAFDPSGRPEKLPGCPGPALGRSTQKGDS
jgi:hypothetical protein